MNASQIEAWALRVIDQTLKGHPDEDARVELKSRWPTDHADVARRIGGLANSTAPEPVMWLIGVDQKARDVVGAGAEDLASWWPQVARWFDELAPTMFDLNVPYAGKVVVALAFGTDRAPFVVKNPAGGKISFEVPWREGTAIRSAHRSDLLRALVPSVALPRVEVLSGSLEVDRHEDEGYTRTGSYRWWLQCTVFVHASDRIDIPLHSASARVAVAGSPPRHGIILGNVGVGDSGMRFVGSHTPAPQPSNVYAMPGVTTIDGPARVSVSASGTTPPMHLTLSAPVRATVELPVVGLDRKISFDIELEEAEVTDKTRGIALWTFHPVLPD